jgi:SAM-dependent methyltransferase
VTAPARSFDGAAAEYERGRPEYPAELLDALPVAAGARVLDLGAGTGKLTRLLVQRYAHVDAVEPLPAMRAILVAAVPSATGVAGTAEAIPFPDASFDAVFAAQAFHWFANDVAIAEIARVLRPGGVLALVWNEGARQPAGFPEAYRARLGELAAGAPFVSTAEWMTAMARGPFDAPQKLIVEHEQSLDRDGGLAYAASASWIASRPEDERRAVLAELADLLPPGSYTVPLQAELTWAVRR